MFMSFSKKIYDKIYAVREDGKPFLKYFSVEDYDNLLEELLVKQEAGELTENKIEEIIGSVITKHWFIDIKPIQ